MIHCDLLIFFQIIFSKISFRNSIKVSNSLKPDQTQYFVGPKLGPNCLQMLSVEKTQADKEIQGITKKFWADLKNIRHNCSNYAWPQGYLCVCSYDCL